jgi:hypothetical protein
MASRIPLALATLCVFTPALSHAIFKNGFEAQPASGPLVINEIESQGLVDYVEFFNASPFPVDLTGWSFTDSNQGNVFNFPDGTVVQPNGHYVVEPFAFGLGSADSVSLIAPGSQVVDFYGWSAHAVETFARCPDGTGSFVDLPGTRGLANC